MRILRPNAQMQIVKLTVWPNGKPHVDVIHCIKAANANRKVDRAAQRLSASRCNSLYEQIKGISFLLHAVVVTVFPDLSLLIAIIMWHPAPATCSSNGGPRWKKKDHS